MDPVLIAILMTFMVGGVLKLAGKAIANSKTELAPRQPAEIESAAPVGWECTEYSQRLLEEKLVEAGAMEAVDMTTCENNDCVLCRPTRNLRRALVEEKAIKVRQERRRAMLETKNEHRTDANLRAGFRNVLDGPSEEIIFNTYELLKETYELHGGCESFSKFDDEILGDDLLDAIIVSKICTCSKCRTVRINGIDVVRPEFVSADAGTTYYRSYDPETIRDYLSIQWQWKENDVDYSHIQKAYIPDKFDL